MRLSVVGSAVLVFDRQISQNEIVISEITISEIEIAGVLPVTVIPLQLLTVLGTIQIGTRVRSVHDRGTRHGH